MPSKKYLIMYCIVTLIPIIVTAIVYPSLAETIPTHFDANNIADAYGSKNSVWIVCALFFIMNIVILGTCILTTKLNNGKKSIIAIHSQFKIAMVAAMFSSFISLAILYSTVSYNEENPVNIMTLTIVPTVIICVYAIYEEIRVKKILKQKK